MKSKLLYTQKYLIISFIFFGYVSSALAQTKENMDEKKYGQLKMAQNYVSLMNTKLNEAIIKSKNFKEMKTNWMEIMKSEPSMVEIKVKEFYSKYKTQITQAKMVANYDESAVASKMSDFLKGTDYKVIFGNGAFIISSIANGSLTPIPTFDVHPDCINYHVEDYTIVPYTAPPEMGILNLPFTGDQDMVIDNGTSDNSGNKCIVDLTVTNGRIGFGSGKLLKIKVPDYLTCADLNILCRLESQLNTFGVMMFGPEVESIARVKVKRIGLPGNFMSDGELYRSSNAYLFGSISQKSFNPNVVSENGLYSVNVNKIIRVRSGDELEVIFEAAAHVISDIGISGRAIGSVKNISVSLCKCE